MSNIVPLDACCQGDIGIAEVSCPEGTEVTGGGYEILGGDITGRGETQPWVDSLTVYAICGALDTHNQKNMVN